MRLILSISMILLSINAESADLCDKHRECQKVFLQTANKIIVWKNSDTQLKIKAVAKWYHVTIGQLHDRQMAKLHTAVDLILVKLGLYNKISPYDGLIKHYSEKHSFDWPLIAAQIFQESRFNPKARSHAGAQGLMQLMPRTAKQLGIERGLSNPEVSIETGVRYMAWLKKRFAYLPAKEQKWFILGAYNAGLGHVRDAQKLAKRLGLRSDRWFGHVEKALLLLSQPRYARSARYGWVRGREPVHYVRSIRRYYRQYLAKLRA